MTPDAWWPAATRREVPYWPEAGTFPGTPLGWIEHVVEGNGSPYSLFVQAKPPNRRFSHLWFGKTGQIEQYAPLTSRSWAQGAGNAQYWSAETEGFPGEPLTDAQLDALAHWHVYSGALYRLAERPGDLGIGTHYMGGTAWGGHSCPDPAGLEGKGPRSLARTEILRRAFDIRSGGDMPLTPDDVTKVATAVWAATFGSPADTAGKRLAAAASAPTALDIAESVVNVLIGRLPAQPGGPTLDQIRQAVHDGVVSAMHSAT